MQIYINKNGEQLGPFEEAKVLEMLRNGQLVPTDYGIKNGQADWQKLEMMFPQVKQVADIPINQHQNPIRNVLSNDQTSPTPQKSSGSKGLMFSLLGCGGFLLLGVIGLIGFLFIRGGSEKAANDNVNIAVSTNSNTNANANTNVKTVEYYKAFLDKKKELGVLKPSVKLDKNARLKGKIAILEKTYYASDEYDLIGFENRGKPDFQKYVSQDESAVKEWGFTLDDLAEKLDELDSVLMITCKKGGYLGQYEGGIKAYSNRCEVLIIDYKANIVIAKKNFENRKPEKEINASSGDKEYVLLHPYQEMQNYVKTLPK